MRNYVKKGYTKKQKEVAAWIVSGREIIGNDTHVMLRIDQILRTYATNPIAKVDSHWFNIVKYAAYSSDVIDKGGGEVEVVGNAGSGGHTQVYKSRYGITIVNTHRLGKAPNGNGHHARRWD